jgi:hypothetical protein
VQDDLVGVNLRLLPAPNRSHPGIVPADLQVGALDKIGDGRAVRFQKGGDLGLAAGIERISLHGSVRTPYLPFPASDPSGSRPTPLSDRSVPIIQQKDVQVMKTAG